MKKLRLHIEDLRVDGFATTPAAASKGTVVGEQGTYYTLCTCAGPTCGATCAYTCDDPTCPACPTCPDTCAQTCDGYSCGFESCGGSCFQSRCVDTCLCN